MEQKGVVTKIEDIGNGVKVFTLGTKERMNFVPGQYALLSTLDHHIKKPFTIYSSPTQNELEFCIKNVGALTGKMHKLEVGEEMIVSGPYGKFTFDEKVNEDVVFVASGTGIAPFISSIRYAMHKNLKNNIILFYTSKTVDEIIAREELEALHEKKIHVVFTVTRDSPADWKFETGRIDLEMIKRHVSHPKKRVWFICGNPKMIEGIKDLLRQFDVPEENIRTEGWEAGTNI